MIYTILIGFVAGFAAGKIMKGRGFGCVTNVLLGLAGALLGRFVFSKSGIEIGYGILPAIVTAMIGAILILAIVNLVKGDS